MGYSWNKGLTKETDFRVAKASETRLRKFAEGNLQPSFGALGKHWNLSEEARRNHSLARMGKSGTLKGRPQSPELIAKRMEGIQKFYETYPRPQWKIPRDSQQYQNISKTFFGKGQPARFSKEKNGMWRGGISYNPYGEEFNNQLKTLIKQRDSYTCQLCRILECECVSSHRIHHIDYNKKNNLPTNLITLCNRCNAKVNSKREYWEGYFVVKMKDIQERYQLKLKMSPDKPVAYIAGWKEILLDT